MAKKKIKQEALTVSRFINEILVEQLKIPFKQIVNDKSFYKYTYLKRPDLLISGVEYDMDLNNEDEYISNLIAYAEVKDNCIVGDKDWLDAYRQGIEKAKKLNISYFIITNCKISYFYNANTGNELSLNGNPIREFQTIDVLRIINKRLQKDLSTSDITTNIDIQSTISEAVFNKKLWELANIYRGIDFKNITEKIDFTIGFIALKYFEEKIEQNNEKDNSKVYWSDLGELTNKRDLFIGSLQVYIERLEKETNFQEFKALMDIVLSKVKSIIVDNTIEMYNIIDSMGLLHGCGFDLFGAVYEMFASNKEKSDFGEFFTRRHYTHIFAKMLLKDESIYNADRKFKILDPACGTGGFLTEAYKILYNSYKASGTLNNETLYFLQNECLYGIDVKEENVSRTKLNMFLVGDGHTHIVKEDSLIVYDKKDTLKRLKWNLFDYIITNPPYGNGTVKAETNQITSSRYEIAFISKIIKYLKVGGKACIITPDGFFENPSLSKFRMEVLQKCEIEAIVSLPKYAFAPYTKEKTYALFITKKSNENTKIQKNSIWMYIIDNDGYANSDKRFPTKLKNKNGSWMHDEISWWVNTEVMEEQVGLLEQRWMKYDDINSNGTSWINEKGEEVRFYKGGFISLININETNYYNLLPEYHLRKNEPNYITIDEFDNELKNIEDLIKKLL